MFAVQCKQTPLPCLSVCLSVRDPGLIGLRQADGVPTVGVIGMEDLLKGFKRFPQPEPGPELLANASANLLIPWWRRGGQGVFEHGAILTEFVPAIVLLHLLCFQPLSLVVSTPGAIVALAIPSLLAFREGICTGEGTVIASILVPLYFLSVVLCLPGLANPFATLCTVVAITVAKLAVCMSAILHRWAAHGAFKCSYPVRLLPHNPILTPTPTPTPTPTLTPAPAPPSPRP